MREDDKETTEEPKPIEPDPDLEHIITESDDPESERR